MAKTGEVLMRYIDSNQVEDDEEKTEIETEMEVRFTWQYEQLIRFVLYSMLKKINKVQSEPFE